MNSLPTLVLLCGGLASRLGSITKKIPKSIIDIDGRPFIEYQLRLLKEKGIDSVLICAGHLSEQIVDFVGDGSSFGLRVTYSIEGQGALLGTGGAICQALDSIESDSFFVIYGDSYLDIDYSDVWSFYQEKGRGALMTIIKNHNKWDKSNIEYKDGRIIAYDKENLSKDMEYIDYGLSIFNKSAFDGCKRGDCFDLSVIHKQMIASNNLIGYQVRKRFYEVGSIQGIDEFKQYIIQGKNG